MAESLKIIRRLDAVTTDYTVFERDQVLTHDQLNGAVEYLSDNGRLTRTQLIGVGLAGGLWPTLTKNAITISCGVGVTTDGDLLGLAQDRTFTEYLPYDEASPTYDRFIIGNKRIPLFELLPAGPDDKRKGKPLAELADSFGKLSLMVFMESYVSDPDLCTGGSCDNRGRTAYNTQRFLLLDSGVAAGMLEKLANGAMVAKLLPLLRPRRPQLGYTLKDTPAVKVLQTFFEAYRNAITPMRDQILKAIDTLEKAFDRAWPDNTHSPASWRSRLLAIDNKFGNQTVGVQYYHAFLKDVMAEWNMLRETLFHDTGVLCPAANAFAKHLLLGSLTDPSTNRTGSYPSPWLTGGNPVREHVSFLIRKIGRMIHSFELPAQISKLPKIIPSRRPTDPLECRAIPIYYSANSEIQNFWHAKRWQRDEAKDNLGYHWMPEPSNTLADPFMFDMSNHDFFRIEGHLGMDVHNAEKEIERLVRERNLPIAVMSVVLHGERRFVLPRPPFKRTSLHSLHYLLRQDLVAQLSESTAFGKKLINDLNVAESLGRKDEKDSTAKTSVFNTNMSSGMSIATGMLEEKQKKFVIGDGTTPGILAARSYSQYSSRNDTTWISGIHEAIAKVSDEKILLGDVTRNDLLSPLDSFSASRSRIWVDWLDKLIASRDDQQKDGRLFTNMVKEHPGLEHFGGAVPGGTFVLVYDDKGIVIGDLMLPYWLEDNDESDKEEPELTLPDIHLTYPPIKVIKPLQRELLDFTELSIMPKIKIQEDYSTFFRESLGSLGEVMKAVNIQPSGSIDLLAAGKYNTGDPLMDRQLEIVDGKKTQVERMRAMRDDPRLTKESKAKVEAHLKQLEGELANAVVAATQHFAIDTDDSVRKASGKTALYQTLDLGISSIQDKEVSGRLQENLKATEVAAVGTNNALSVAVVKQVMLNAGFRTG